MTCTSCCRTVALSFCAIFGAMLVAAYIVICLRTGTVWPWSLYVHETGLRTLTGTVFYFEHAARELPLDLVLGITIGGCLLMVCPPDRCWPAPQGAGRRRSRRFALATALVVAVILGGAWVEIGWRALLDNLLQYHTRPSFGLEWGSHWRYHLLSRLALILGSVGLAGLLCLFTGAPAGRGRRDGLAVALVSLAVFFIATIIFTASPQDLLLVFVDPYYLGHQTREVLTHVAMTLPAGWGISLLFAGRASDPNRAPKISWPTKVAPFHIWTIGSGFLAAGLSLYLLVGAMINDAGSLGQTRDTLMLIFPHFFEHSFTYLVVPAVALLTYQMVGNAAVAREGARGAALAEASRQQP